MTQERRDLEEGRRKKGNLYSSSTSSSSFSTTWSTDACVKQCLCYVFSIADVPLSARGTESEERTVFSSTWPNKHMVLLVVTLRAPAIAMRKATKHTRVYRLYPKVLYDGTASLGGRSRSWR